MAEVFYIKKGDRAPSVEATLRRGDRTAIDLTSVTSINFQMGELDNSAVIVDAEAGTVRYDWGSDETDTPGVFNAEFKILWNDGREQTVPNRSHIKVYITEDVEE